MKKCLPSVNQKIPQKFQHIFKADLIPLANTVTHGLAHTTKIRPLKDISLHILWTGVSLKKHPCYDVQECLIFTISIQIL